MTRWDVINKFIKERGYKSYLEIGYYKGWSFDNISCESKIAVDPNPSKIPEQENASYGKTILHLKPTGIERLIKMTSDEFFENNTQKYDIIFIDGLHEAKQVQKDILNSLRSLNNGGVIILHDCNPPTEQHTLEGGVDGCWNGDVYKTIMAFKILNPNIYTLDTDWGIGIIEKFDLADIEIINELDWNYFNNNRQQSIGLRPIDKIDKYVVGVDPFNKTENSSIGEVKIYKKDLTVIPEMIPFSYKREMIFLSAQPDEFRFSFQLEIFIENIINIGYTNDVHIVMYTPQDRIGNRHQRYIDLEERYKQSHPNIKFFWYEDVNNEVVPILKKIDYVSIIRPWVLKHHFTKYPELKEKAIFYHDNDIIFTKYMDFTPYLNDDIVYMSNTDHYMNVTMFFESPNMYARAIPEKVQELKNTNVLDTLAKMNGISRDICLKNDNNTGGAQCLLKNIDAKYWDDVYNSCILIKNYLSYHTNGINKQFFRSEDNGFQSWCADMWAVLWNLWKRSIETRTPKEFDFLWASDEMKKATNNPHISIYHDAGVNTGKNDHNRFNKGKFEYKHNGGVVLPYIENLGYVSPDTASYIYAKEIERVKNKYNY